MINHSNHKTMNAITKLICILIIFSIAKPIIAQHQKIKISYEPTADGYDFYADNSTLLKTFVIPSVSPFWD